MSTIKNLKDLYVHNLKDLYNANTQSADVMQKLHSAADDSELKGMLKANIRGIHDGNEKIESILEAHGEQPGGVHCKGMEGLVKEAEAHGIKAQYADPALQDAAIVPQVQRMSHYAIAGYGSCRSFAKKLGLKDDAQHLDTNLDNTYEGDKKLSKLAEGKSGLNADAAAAA